MGKRKVQPADVEEDPSPPKKTPKAKQGQPLAQEPYASGDGWMIQPPALLHKAFGTSTFNKVAAFDLDDTLVKHKSSRSFALDADDFKLYNKKVPKVLQAIAAEGYRIVIFSNQGSVKSALEGKASEKVRKRADNIVAELDVPVHIFYATADEKNETDTFRKPRPGMWDLLIQEHMGGIAPDMKNSYFVGDAAGRPGDFSDSDKKFAEAVGLVFKTPEEVFGESDSKKAVNTQGTSGNLNQAMSDAFRQLATLMQQQGANEFGIRAVSNVASIIGGFPSKITSSKDLKNVKGVGKSSLAKVDEFLSIGTFKALEDAGVKPDKLESSADETANAAAKFL